MYMYTYFVKAIYSYYLFKYTRYVCKVYNYYNFNPSNKCYVNTRKCIDICMLEHCYDGLIYFTSICMILMQIIS